MQARNFVVPVAPGIVDADRALADAGGQLFLGFAEDGRRSAADAVDLVLCACPPWDPRAADAPASTRIGLGLSRDLLARWLRRPDRMVGRKIRAAGWGRVLSEFVGQVAETSAAGAPADVLDVADQIGTLLRVVESEVFGAGSEDERPRAPPSKILDAIRQRCGEISLSAGDVARAAAISERTLHRHLRLGGETFGRALRRFRIEAARRMLEARHFSTLTTADIGRRAGFGDPSHFARVMREALGKSPEDYRRGRLEIDRGRQRDLSVVLANGRRSLNA